MFRIVHRVDYFYLRLEARIAWLLVVIAVVQVLLVFGRGLFQFSTLQGAEALVYFNAVVMSLGIACALPSDAHARIDVVRTRLTPRGKRTIDRLGAAIFLIPSAGALIWFSWDYVGAAWLTREGSRSVGGFSGVYLVKSVLLVLPAMLILGGVMRFIQPEPSVTSE